LSERQLTYALNDVLYLLPAWKKLEATLAERNRIPWVIEESENLTRQAASRRAPEEAYLQVGGWNSLRGAALGSLRALAAWREMKALDTNKPPSWLLTDSAMIDLARHQSKSERALRKTRGVPAAIAADLGHEILAAIEAGAEDPPALTAAQETLHPREQVLVSVVLGILQGRCLAEDLPPRFAGTRSDAEELVRYFLRDPADAGAVALLSGWRNELVGADALAWLRGERVLTCDPGRPGLLALR
jgi:ribonuclease D